jgi:two-component system phosphate regulon response regulator PhoB
VVTDRNIDVHVRSIRKKLGSHSELIETVRGVGYRFREDAA